MRHVYFLLGWCFFGLGAAGAVIPGLPTVPLMLVALWAFSRSSERFHDWLYDHSLFGPPLQQWRSHRVIPVRAKILAVATMLGSLAYMVLATGMSTWIKALVVVFMLIGAVFILSQKSRLPEESS